MASSTAPSHARLNHHTGTAEEDPRLRNLANRKICSNVLLQQLMFYGLFFDIGWITFWAIWVWIKYSKGLLFKDDDVARMVMTLLWLISEPFRMTAGWYGNSQENMPWMILFCILSCVPIQVIVFYIMINGFDMDPVSTSVQYAQAIMVELQLLVGIYSTIRLHKQQKQQYYLFEYVMNQRRRNDAYRLEQEQGRESTNGGIGRGGKRKV